MADESHDDKLKDANNEAAENETAEKTEDVTSSDIDQAETEQHESTDGAATQAVPSQNPVKRWASWYWQKKLLTLPLSVIALVAILAAVPASRYAIAGTFMTHQVNVTVVDSVTNKPVSEADVTLAGQSARTNAEGLASFKSKVGNQTLAISKKYFQDNSKTVLVPIGGKQLAVNEKLTATGRQVAVKVVNTVGGTVVEGVSIAIAGTTAKTDDKGTTTIVVPASGEFFEATLSKDGFNDQKSKVGVGRDQLTSVTLKLTPTGKVYFLSKLSGKIDVVKTNLDGSDRQTVLAGTGKEQDTATSLLASRDWKYLVLQAKREGDKARLYLINTATDKLTTIDEGNAVFTASGWAGHNFVYSLTRENVKSYQPKRAAVKSFNADTNQINVVDETQGYGVEFDYKSEDLNQVILTEDEIVWSKYWYYSYAIGIDALKNTITRADVDGKNKKVIKEVPLGSSANMRLYEPKELLITWYENGNYVFYKYEDGKVTEDKNTTIDAFNKSYPTYLLSPNGKNTFWSESRDGKNFLFVGDEAGENSKTIATLPDFSVYGWYTDDYLLVSKKGSELYALPAAGVASEEGLTKISDYHKPDFSYRGYGGGYGGL